MVDFKAWLRKIFNRTSVPSRRQRRLLRSARPMVEFLENRLAPAVSLSAVWVNDNWNLVVDLGTPGLSIGDIVQNSNDTIAPNTIVKQYGIDGFGTVTTFSSGTGAGVPGSLSGAATINDAIGATATGGTVNVLEGTYHEMAVVNKSLTLQGAQSGVDARTRAAVESVMDATGLGGAFDVHASNVTIDGFTIQGQTGGFPGAAVWLEAGTAGTHLLNNVVRNNVVGLFLANNSAANQTVIEKNLFQTNNNPGAASGAGIYTDQFVAGGTVTNVLIDSNKFVGNADAGIDFSSTDITKPVTGITISNNTFDANSRALVAFNLTNSSITTNDILNSTGAATADLRLFEGVNNVTISGNRMANGAGKALRISNIGTGSIDAANVTFTGNSITGYVGVGGVVVQSDNYTGTLNASANWWGTTVDTAIFAEISGLVDFTPYLGTGANTSTATGFQGDLSSLYVTALGAQSGGTGRIQEAFNLLADGALVGGNRVINVNAGTFDELLVIDKSMKLLGANAGVHPAVGANTSEVVGVRGAETILSHNGFYALSPQAANITIDGFTFSSSISSRIIDSDSADSPNLRIANNIFNETGSSSSGTGVIQLVNGDRTNMVIEFNKFLNQGGAASIYAGGPTGDFAGLKIANNYFKVNAESVFWAAESLDNGVVANNEFDGNLGTGSGLLNIGQGGNISIRENNFHDMNGPAFQVGIIGGEVVRNSFTAISNASGVIQLWGGEFGTPVSNNVDIANNTIHFNDSTTASVSGIRLRPAANPGDPQIDGSTIHIHDNAFINGGARTPAQGAFAIRDDGDPTKPVDASGNWWSTTSDTAILGLMSGPVDFTPFLDSGTDGAGVGFQGDFSKLNVTALGSQTTATGRITEAIGLLNDSVPGGGLINVLSGSYTEDVNTTTKKVTLAVGGAGLVTLNGNLTLDGNDTFAVDIAGPTPGTGYDQLVVNGTVALGNAVLNMSFSYVPAATDAPFVFIANDGSDAINGKFASVPTGTGFALISPATDGTSRVQVPNSATATNGIYYLLYDGSNHLGNEMVLDAATQLWSAAPLPAGWSKQLVGDFNGDGMNDIATYYDTNGKWLVSISTGTGFQAPVTWSQFGTPAGWVSQVVGDFDNDGKDDIAQFNTGNGTWWVSVSDGAHFTTSRWAIFGTASGWMSQIVGDFNSDGRADIANYQPSNGTWWVSISDGTRFMTSRWAIFGTAIGWTSQIVGDFNNDGRDDIANFHPSNGSWWVSLSDGTRFTTSRWAMLGSGNEWSNQVVGDFNNDGKADIGNFHSSDATWWISVSSGSTFTTTKWDTLPFSSGWTSQLVGDFDGDGLADIASFHSSDASWWVSTSNGSSFTTLLQVQHVNPGDWNTHLVGDFNGHHQSELADLEDSTELWWVSYA